MGYREYLATDQAERSSLLKGVRDRVREILTRFGSIQREWMAEIQQVRATLPASKPAASREGVATQRVFSSHEEALSALFPDRITDFFPEHIHRQLILEQEQAKPTPSKAKIPLEEPFVDDFDEGAVLKAGDPLGAVVTRSSDSLEANKPVVEPEAGYDESLERIRAAFRELVRPSDTPKTPSKDSQDEAPKTEPQLAHELRRVITQESSSEKTLSPKVPVKKTLLDERRLDRMNEGRFQTLLRRNKSLSGNINQLAESYFSQNRSTDQGTRLPGC